MADIVNALREQLRVAGLVRRPDEAGPGARPWLPPAWKHPEKGAVGPGDAKQQGMGANAQDDGLVVSLMWAPGIPPAPGAEERRQDGVDVWLRSNVGMAPLLALEAAIRLELIGTNPGGRTDWMMGGAYVIQSRQWRPFQPLDTGNDVLTFSTGYIFETRVA